MRLLLTGVLSLAIAAAASADPLTCDLSAYRAATGLTAAAQPDALTLTWAGEDGSELRARFGIDAGQPVVRELAVRKASGQWTVLGTNLVPDFHVTTGVRRLTTQQ